MVLGGGVRGGVRVGMRVGMRVGVHAHIGSVSRSGLAYYALAVEGA